MPCRSEIEKLEPSPFKDVFVEWSRLDSLLSKYYGDTYMGAINQHTGRYTPKLTEGWQPVALLQTACCPLGADLSVP